MYNGFKHQGILDMNNSWKKIKEKKAREICNNAFLPPSYSTNQLWKKKKGEAKNWIVQCEFQHNNLVYKTICYEEQENIENIFGLDLTWQTENTVKLINWNYNNVECTIHISEEDDEGYVTTLAEWYDQYYHIRYFLFVRHKRDLDPHIVSIVEAMEDNSPRTKSNERNIIFISAGILYILVCAFFISNYFFHFIGIYLSGLSITYLMVLGIYMLIYGWVKGSDISNQNKFLKKLPYEFDIEKELESFTNIGSKLNKYKENGIYFNKYDEWNTYIKDRFYKQLKDENKNNFFHYINREYRFYRDFVDTIKTVLFPGFLVIVPALSEADSTPLGVVLLIVVLIYTIMEIASAEKRRDLMLDIAKILYPKEKLE